MGILILPGRVCIAALIIPSREWVGFFPAQDFLRFVLYKPRSEDTRRAGGKAEVLKPFGEFNVLWLLSALAAENSRGFPRISGFGSTCPWELDNPTWQSSPWNEDPATSRHGNTPCCFPLLAVEGLKVVEIEKCKRDIKKMREEMAARSSR